MFRSMRFCYFLKNNYLKLHLVGMSSRSSFGESTMRRTVFQLENLDEMYGETLLQENLARETVVSPIYSESVRYWLKVLNCTKEITWEEELCKKEVPKEKLVNKYAVIFLLCQKNQFYNHMISLFGYLLKNNELTAGLLNLFCNCMFDKPEVFKCCEKGIYKIFKSVIHTDKISARICSRVLLQSKTYSKSVYKHYKEYLLEEKNHTSIIMGLLATNKFFEALELYVQDNGKVFALEKIFLTKLLEKTVKGENTVPDVIKFFEATENIKSDLVITDDCVEVVKKLFNKLRDIDDDYVWTVQKGAVLTNECCFCHGNLIPAHLTQEEVDELLINLEKSVIVQGNIFLKSNVNEWKKFCDHVEKTDYNIVMDGLNVRCGSKTLNHFEKVMQQLSKKKFSPFILGRAHFVKYPEYKLVKDKYPIFLTENLSDDDVFVLYAALKKGMGCFTLSNDKMRFCNSLLPTQNLINIYKRWQAMHQCKLGFNSRIIFPNSLLNGLQKSDNSDPGEFRYHYIASMNNYEPTFFCISRIKKQKEFKPKLASPHNRVRILVRDMPTIAL